MKWEIALIVCYLLDVDQFISDVHFVAPELWEHVCTLTQSVNECKGCSAAVDEASFSGRIKRLCRAYLLSLMLFELHGPITLIILT